jgi:CDP-2,3-bis-(O-geranylgeranyl)-sn-glycerol synthase
MTAIDVSLIAGLLLLLLMANGAPILARNLFASAADWPIDAGYIASDGYRLLGPSKTWRGLVAAVVATAALAALLGYPLLLGALFGLYAMLGDLLTSFIKRRLGLLPSARAFGLDQLPEAVLPLALLHAQMGLDWLHGIVLLVLFIVTDVLLSRLLYRLKIRRRPY